MREHEIEPVPGLPEHLPAGETILWQGAPDWRDLAVRVFHIRGVALYFAALFAYLGWSAHAEGQTLDAALWTAVKPLPIAAAVIGLLLLLAHAMARTTLYTVTSRRIVMRFGLALPMSANLPFGEVRAADVTQRGNGKGDIAIALQGPRQSLIVLWPHVRPWRTTKPEPMLRSLPDVATVSALLGNALTSFHGASATAPARKPERTPQRQPVPSAEPAAA